VLRVRLSVSVVHVEITAAPVATVVASGLVVGPGRDGPTWSECVLCCCARAG